MPYPDWLSISEINVTYNGEDITNLVESAQWSGSEKDVFRKLSLTMNNTEYGREKMLEIVLGGEIVFSNNDEVIFQGVIFEDGINIEGTQTITAYDENVFLTKNDITRKFVDKTASQILRQLCNDFGIETGTIADTGYVFSSVIFRNKTIAKVMEELLETTYKQIGKKYRITNVGGAVTLLSREGNVVDYPLENAVNITGASYSKSIEDTRTRVKVIGKDKKENPITELAISDFETDFGTMQRIEEVNDSMTKSEAKQRAQELLKQLETIDDDASVSALGDNRVISGVQLNVSETMTGLEGQYYVTSDTHTFSNGLHTMTLNITATDA